MMLLEIIALLLAHFLSLASVDPLTANVFKSCRKVSLIYWEFLSVRSSFAVAF